MSAVPSIAIIPPKTLLRREQTEPGHVYRSCGYLYLALRDDEDVSGRAFLNLSEYTAWTCVLLPDAQFELVGKLQVD